MQALNPLAVDLPHGGEFRANRSRIVIHAQVNVPYLVRMRDAGGFGDAALLGPPLIRVEP